MSLLKFSVLGLCMVFAGISIVLSHRSEDAQIIQGEQVKALLWGDNQSTRISPPKIYQQADKVIYFKDRDTVRLNCVASGSPQPEYRWERNGLPYYADNLRIHRYGSRTGSLIFNPATSLDAGYYQCFADNGHGVSMSQKMHLITAVLDSFPDQLSRTVQVDPGDHLLLQCISPRSIPRPDIYWVTRREGSSQLQVVETDDRITIDEFDNLLFANVMKADEREGRGYSCVVVNNIKRDMVIGPITYIELAYEGPQKAAPAVYFMSSPSDSLALVGQALKLQCIFAGNPTPNVTWEYDITNPASSIKYTEDFGKTLKFENVTQADEGVYTCHGFNSQSRVVAARRITVRVQALPYWTTRPRDQEARVGESVTFTCEASGRPVPLISGLSTQYHTTMWTGRDQSERDSHHLYELCSEAGVTPEICKLKNWHADYINSLFSLEGVANYESDVDYVFHALLVGSNAEGIGLERLGSDYNVMMTVSGTRIVAQRQPEGSNGEGHIFRIVQTSHPLYVRLQCVHMGKGTGKGVMPTPSCCVGDEQGRMILSGKLLTDAYSHSTTGNINAPAISAVLRGDTVNPILCIHSPVWPLAAREWAFRVRRFVWPSVELKRLILQHGCHVVPKGNPQSPNKHLEWRWSFSLAEKMLIRTFNIIQLQCYFLMKMMVTYVVNPMVLDELSSYEVKTVMLHMVETTHPAEWVKEKLAPCFCACLSKLLQCVEEGSLPHYFIPTLNLFVPKIQGESRIRLVNIISGLLEKGWQCVLQCLPPNMNMLLARHKIQTRCDCYDTHWGVDKCESNVSMVERSYTLLNMAVRVILRLAERSDLQTTIDAMMMFLDYPAAKDDAHFPDVLVTALVKQTIKSHIGYCYLGLSQTYPYNRKQSDDARIILDKGLKVMEESLSVDAISAKLKLATFYFMLNKLDDCINILMQLLRQYNAYIVNTTGDKTRRLKSHKRTTSHRRHRSVTSLLGNAQTLLEWASFEVCFSPWEIPFAPEAIQMLRDREAITDDDTDYKGFVFVDAIVYAYFLLCLSYNSLHRPVHRQQALENLNLLVKNSETNDLHYPEVARFLLPYCKERKHRNCLLCHVRIY